MDSENFYLHLNSDVIRASPDQVDNTIGNFITRLNRRYNLSDDWEIAMSRIHYVMSWYNVPSDQKLYLVNKNSNGEKMVEEIDELFPAGYYNTVDEMLGIINQIYADYTETHPKILKEAPFFAYNNYSNKVRIRLGKIDPKSGADATNLYFPQFSPFLAEFLGLTDSQSRQYPYVEKGLMTPVKYKNKNIINNNSSDNMTISSIKNIMMGIMRDEPQNNRSNNNESEMQSDQPIELNQSNNEETDEETQPKNFEISHEELAAVIQGSDSANVSSIRNIHPISNLATKIVTSHLITPKYGFIDGFKQVSLHGYIKNLNVYCSLIKPVSVGDVEAPLLRSVPVETSRNFGDMISYEPREREYNELLYKEFDQIEIDIKNDYDQTVPFKFGKIYLSLHFRKIKK